MSKAGKTKFKWYDEDEDNFYSNDGKRRNKNKEHDRRIEKRLKSAIKIKNLDYLTQDDDN